MSLGNLGAAPPGGQPTGEHDYEEATVEEIDTEEVETTSDVKVEIVEQNEEPEVASVFVGNNFRLFSSSLTSLDISDVDIVWTFGDKRPPPRNKYFSEFFSLSHIKLTNNNRRKSRNSN